MEPGPSGLSGHTAAKQLVCMCHRYCKGQPRLLSETTFYRHLSEVEEDERHKLEAIKAASLDAARMILTSRGSLDNRAEQSTIEAGPSKGTSLTARRTASLQILAKRAREDPDSQRRVGKRKCARNKENVGPNVSSLDISERVNDDRLQQIEEPERDQSIFYPPPDPPPSPHRVNWPDSSGGEPDERPPSRSPTPPPGPDLDDQEAAPGPPPLQNLDGSGEEPDERPPSRSPTPPPGPDLDDQEAAPGPPPVREGLPRIEYNRRLPPPINLVELSRITVLLKLQQHLAFITIVQDASLLDPIAKMTKMMLTHLQSPP